MNKGLKLLAKIGLGCCLIGTLLCLVGWVGGADIGAAINSDTIDIEYDADYHDIDVDTRFMNDLYTNKATETWSLEEFENISAELAVSELIICGGDEFSMTYTDSKYDFDKNNVKYKIEDGTLYLEEEEDDYWGVQADSLRKIEIHIPKDHKLGEVEIDKEVGNTVVHSLDLRKLDIENEVGNTRLNNMTMDFLTVESEVGNIQATAMYVMEGTEITSEIGDTDLVGDFLGDVRLNNGIGHMEVTLWTELDKYYKVVEGEPKGLSTSYTRKYDPSTHPTRDPNAPNRLTIKNGGGQINFNV